MAERGEREGQQLGNYRAIRLIGRGGFAEVYLGEHIYLKTQLAIKLLHTWCTHISSVLWTLVSPTTFPTW